MFHITVTLVAIMFFSGYFGGLSVVLKTLSVVLGMVTGLQKIFDGKTQYKGKSQDLHQTLRKKCL